MWNNKLLEKQNTPFFEHALVQLTLQHRHSLTSWYSVEFHAEAAATGSTKSSGIRTTFAVCHAVDIMQKTFISCFFFGDGRGGGALSAALLSPLAKPPPMPPPPPPPRPNTGFWAIGGGGRGARGGFPSRSNLALIEHPIGEARQGAHAEVLKWVRGRVWCALNVLAR